MNTKFRVTFFLPCAVFQSKKFAFRYRCLRAKSLWLCVALCNLWIVAVQAPQYMRFSREEYWSGLPFLNPGDLPHPGMEPTSLTSPALAGRFFTTSAAWEAHPYYKCCLSKQQENIRYLRCFLLLGNTGKSMADSCQCMTKPTTIL